MLFFVMLFLSGASVPTEVMSGTMTKIGDFLPLTYGVDLLQKAWISGTWDWSAAIVLVAIAVVAGFLSLLLPLGMTAACGGVALAPPPGHSSSNTSRSRFFTAGPRRS